MYRLVLASASPRRRELLAQAGYAFTVHPAHIPEDPLPNEDPIAYVVRLAREKAEAVLNEIAAGAKTPYLPAAESARPKAAIPPFSSAAADEKNGAPTGMLIVLGADTTVVLDDQILAKPADAEDAKRMLRLLSGRTHRVITGVALATEAGTEVAAEVTAVRSHRRAAR